MRRRARQDIDAPAPSCWELLGLAPGASEAEIDRAEDERAAKLRRRRDGGKVELAELRAARDEALRQLVLAGITKRA